MNKIKLLWIPVLLIFGLWLTRFVLPSQLDDVNPLINCEEKLLQQSDVYFVIPKFENISIEKEWCNKILLRNKTLAMHGVYHTYQEFGIYRNSTYLDEGIEISQSCFGFEPEEFKPPQLKWTKENNWIKQEMKLDLFWNQLFHKVYHCQDTGLFPNWFIRIF